MNETTPPPGTPGAQGAQGGPTQQPFGEGFFTWVRGLGLSRSEERWFAGVAGGIAAKANIDPLIVRGLFVVLALLGGPGLVLYLAGWLLLPDSSGRIHLEDLIRGRSQTGVVIAAVAIAALVVLPILLPALSIWHWDLWSALGIPGWLTATFAWLFWIAVIVAVSLWIRQVLLRHGRAQSEQRAYPTPGTQASGAASAPAAGTAAPGAPQAQTPPQAWAQPAGTTGAPGTASAQASAGGAWAGAGTPAPEAGPTGTASFSQQADDWGRRVGEQTREWGQRAGERATQWSEQVGKQADDWSARYAEHHDRFRLGTAHVVLTLAFALLAGGAAALWALSLGVGTGYIVTASLLGATGVLAVSLIIAGIRGKHTGWVGFLAFCGVIALVCTSVLPGGTRFQPFGNMHVGTDAPGAVLLAGNTRVDLTQLDGRTGPHDLVVWQLFGNSTITLPENQPVTVKARVLAGSITAPDRANPGERLSTGGPFVSRTIMTGTGSSSSVASTVTVYVLAGEIRVNGGTAFDSGTVLRPLTSEDRADLREDLRDLQEELTELQWETQKPGLPSAQKQRLEDRLQQTQDEIDRMKVELAR